MRWMFAVLGIVVTLVAGLVPPTEAQPIGQSPAVVALHAGAHTGKGWKPCEDGIDLRPCGDYVTSFPVGYGADVYVVVARADSALGISGLSCGIDYGSPGVQSDGAGVDLFGYALCSDLEVPASPDADSTHAWPTSGGGNLFLWEPAGNCRRNVVAPYGVQAIACAVYVYTYGAGQLAITPNPAGANGPEFQVTDCVGPTAWDLEWPSHAGVVGFDMDGYNPCTALGVPVEATTWGRLKSQYR